MLILTTKNNSSYEKFRVTQHEYTSKAAVMFVATTNACVASLPCGEKY